MFIAKDLNLNFGSQVIFDNISFTLNTDQRIGLVGRNGAGKTTLLSIIAGQSGFDSGFVETQKDKKMAYLPQNVVLVSEKSIFIECLNSFNNNLGDLIYEFWELEKQLENNDTKIVERYAELHHKLDEFDYQKKILESKNILLGLGFVEKDLENLVSTLSVGWKMRLVLAKLLLQKADFYLLDEPTNHLDLTAKDWFLSFLKNSNFGFMLVSHDKYFLDKLCTQIYELSLGNLNIYTGNYSSYLIQKQEREELLEKKYIEQQKFLKKEMAVIDRFRASATKSSMAQSKLKALKKIEIIKLEPGQKTVRINFGEIKKSGKIGLIVKKLSKYFGEKKIFENASFEIERGEKVAIVAPNGQGKSTLLNVIMSKLKADSGSFEFGYNTFPAFFEQDQNKSLNPKNDILTEVESACKTTEQRQKVRAYLGAFLFSGQDVEKYISVLSGGEKNRVAMVKVLLADANFLILDEPTNHLDIQSKEVLLQVLKDYSGTILFVSHDRDFLNNLATSIIELKQDSSYKYKGNYDAFLVQKNAQREILHDAQVIESKAKEASQNLLVRNLNSNSGVTDYEKRKKIRNLESKIDKLEKELEELTKKFEDLEYGSQEYNHTFDSMNKIEKELNENLAFWESLI
ncbi:ATP-binding cassette domain-containing protein [Candidatus Dependentiae bacterium]|nr:ATP-binding cassette domain-containing protein [Candidatus Dependentiae bacterium]